MFEKVEPMQALDLALVPAPIAQGGVYVHDLSAIAQKCLTGDLGVATGEGPACRSVYPLQMYAKARPQSLPRLICIALDCSWFHRRVQSRQPFLPSLGDPGYYVRQTLVRA
jgi:hypothetical protein